jgi:hypothetical protein
MIRYCVAGALIVAAGSFLTLSANASPAAAGAADIQPSIEQLNTVQNAQYVVGGRQHCWYGDGWHGAGWYWCGYRHRPGLGWGGPAGWHGWRTPNRVRNFREHETD